MQIKQTAQRLVSREFIHHAATLISGNLMGQLIAFGAYLVLCRMYSPEAFGLLHLFLSVGGFFCFFTTCSFHYAIVLPRNDKMGIACVQICLIINLIASALCLLISLTMGPWLTQLTHTTALNHLLPLLSLYILLGGLWSTFNYWLIRHKQFRSIASYQVTLNTTTSVAKIGFATASLPNGLIAGTLLGQGLALCTLAPFVRRQYASLTQWSKIRFLVCLRKYSNFLRFTFPKDLVNYVGGNLPSLLLAPFFPLAELGFFGMAITLAMRPINLIVNAIYQALYQQCIEAYHKQHSMRYLGSLFLKACAIIVPCFAVLFAFLHPLVDFLLGEEWHATAHYLQIILPWMMLTLLLNPFDYLPDIFGRQRVLLYLELLQTLLRTVAVLIGIQRQDFALGIALYTASTCTIMVIRAVWYFTLVYHYEKSIPTPTPMAD